MAASTLSDDGDHGFQIAPMVDVVFVLLLFFMVLAGASQIERHLKVPLPGDRGDLIEPPIVFDLAADGTVSMNGLAMVAATDADTACMDRWFARYGDTITASTQFVVRPSNDARHQRVMEVLNSVQKAGYKNVAFR